MFLFYLCCYFIRVVRLLRVCIVPFYFIVTRARKARKATITMRNTGFVYASQVVMRCDKVVRRIVNSMEKNSTKAITVAQRQWQ